MFMKSQSAAAIDVGAVMLLKIRGAAKVVLVAVRRDHDFNIGRIEAESLQAG